MYLVRGLPSSLPQRKHQILSSGRDVNKSVRFMLRCLHRRLPRHRITRPTRSSENEHRFTKIYRVFFTNFITKHGALVVRSGVTCIDVEKIYSILRKWLESRVNETDNAFQWEGFVMSEREIASVTKKTYADWLGSHL